MRLQVRGDFAALKGFQSQLKSVPSALATLNRQVAEETVELIREGFERSRDPYDNRWDDLALREGRPLEDTGRLKASWHVAAATRDGFKIASGVRYAAFHQHGTGIYGRHHQRIRAKRGKALRLRNGLLFASVKGTPVRKMIPDSGPLPIRWRKRYVETANEVLRELFR